MTDLEINKALAKLAGRKWYDKGVVNNIKCTRSLDPILALAGKLGYSVRIFDGYCLQEHVTVNLRKTAGPDRLYALAIAEKNVTDTVNRQYARRLALCEAILKAEGKWEDS